MTWEQLAYTLEYLSRTNKRERRRQVRAVLDAMSACPPGRALVLKLTDARPTAHEIWNAFDQPTYLRWWLRKVWGKKGLTVDAITQNCRVLNVTAKLVGLWPAKSAEAQVQRQCDAIRYVFGVYGEPRVF